MILYANRPRLLLTRVFQLPRQWLVQAQLLSSGMKWKWLWKAVTWLPERTARAAGPSLTAPGSDSSAALLAAVRRLPGRRWCVR